MLEYKQYKPWYWNELSADFSLEGRYHDEPKINKQISLTTPNTYNSYGVVKYDISLNVFSIYVYISNIRKKQNKNQIIDFHRVFNSDIKKLLWWFQKVHIRCTRNNVVLYVSRISCIIYFCMIPNKF